MYNRLNFYTRTFLLILFFSSCSFSPTDPLAFDKSVSDFVSYMNNHFELLNNNWSPLIRSFGDTEMVLVPPGCFMMGSTQAEIQEAYQMCQESDCRDSTFEATQPSHEVCFNKPFWIDQYEVSNSQYDKVKEVAPSNSSHWQESERPRENITWIEANDFCQSRGARLPTEAEWEYAARGPLSLSFPWGETFRPELAVFNGNSNGQTAYIGSKENQSWVGAFDMSGNVWEWVNTIYDPITFPYPYSAVDGREDNTSITGISSQRVLRGGSWLSEEFMLFSWYRLANNDIDYSTEWGFRCVKDK